MPVTRDIGPGEFDVQSLYGEFRKSGVKSTLERGAGDKVLIVIYDGFRVNVQLPATPGARATVSDRY